ncbi:hypothetical protein SLA2020_397250 [Shorea laevis]
MKMSHPYRDLFVSMVQPWTSTSDDDSETSSKSTESNRERRVRLPTLEDPTKFCIRIGRGVPKPVQASSVFGMNWMARKEIHLVPNA